MGLSLRFKWLVALLTVGAIPLVAFAAIGLGIQRRALEETERNLEAAVVDEAAENVSGVFDGLEAATREVAKAISDDKIRDPDARIAVAKASVTRAAAVDCVAVYSPDGTFVDAIATGPVRADVDVPKKLTAEWTSGRPGIFVTFTDERVEIVSVSPILSGEVNRGYTLGRVDVSKLSERIVALSRARFGNEGRIVVVDGRVRMIAGGRPEMRPGRSIPELSARASSLGVTGTTNTFPFVSPTGEAMVGTLRSVPERGFGVFVSRPEAEAFVSLGEARRALLYAAIGFVVLAVVASAWLARRTTKPLVDLVRLTERYGRREFDARSTVKTGDEVERLGTSLEKMADGIRDGEEEIRRRAAVEANLARYMPAEVVREVVAGKSSLALGGERRDVSVVFADVASFTTFAETAPPEEVVTFLNELFTVLSEIVFRHQGMVDKFVGDCVMAVFGTSGDPTHAESAIRAAEEMHRFVETLAPDWLVRFGIEVKLGIGVASGAALVGNLGSETRMEYTAIGDTVNVASRLETLARPGTVLVTAQVVEAVSGAEGGYEFRSLGRQTIRGKKEPLELFELGLDG